MEPRRARDLWHLFEPVHAVTYFAPESTDAFREVGLKGFWMGYFAARSCPLGAVGPGPVTAAFFNFHPAMVARAIPDAWTFAAPEIVGRARGESAARVLRRLCPGVDADAEALVGLLGPLVAGAEGGGRVLFSANRDLGSPDDPVQALFQLTTCLREHRGDGHVASLVVHGLAPCEALVLFARSEAIPDEVFIKSRGWSESEWEAAEDSLRSRGLLDEGGITDAGRARREVVESTTDELAATLFSGASDTELRTMAERFGRVAGELHRHVPIPYPNPIGLPAPER